MFNGSVKVPESLDRRLFADSKQIDTIEGLSKINFIVGPNNSGKSYLQRELLKSFYNIKTVSFISKELQEIFNNLINEFVVAFNYFILDKLNVKLESENYSNVSFSFTNDYNINYNTTLLKLKDSMKEPLLTSNFYLSLTILREFIFSKKTTYLNMELESNNEVVFAALTDLVDQNELAEEFCNYLVKLKNVPLIQECKNLIDDYSRFKYREPNLLFISHFRYCSNILSSWAEIESNFKEIYDFGGYSNFHFINGFNYPTEFKKIQTSGPKGDTRLKDYDEFLQANFFDPEKVRVRYNSNLETKDGKLQKEIEVQIGDNEVRSLYELGTGLQMLLVLTLPLFEKDSGVIFIEEPELFLHPGLQRKLMEIYATHPRSKNFQFFISTHSNHILDCAQYNRELTSIYRINKRRSESESLTKEPSFEIKNISSNDMSILQDLGILNSSVFLANCTIWVEGITDVLYIRTFMKYYSKAKKIENDYIENLHFMFIPYGGIGNLHHWDFESESNSEGKVQSFLFSKKIFLIADNDIDEKNKTNLKESIKENFYILEFDCIEKTLLEFEINAKECYEKYQQGILDKQTEKPNYDVWFKEVHLKEKRKFAVKQIQKIDKKAEVLGDLNEVNLKELLSESAIKLCDKIYTFIKISN